MDTALRELPAGAAAPRSSAATVAVRHRAGSAPGEVSERVAAELPVAIFYNGVSHVVMMATPSDLEDFAVGFSVAEGILGGIGEIERVACSAAERGVKLSLDIPARRADVLAGQRRNLAGRAGCGLCGVTSIEQALRPLPVIRPAPTIAAAAIDRAIASLPALQSMNRLTGAMHAAAFADRAGNVVLLREDVGRHNALDKLIGATLRAGLKPRDGFALVTSRCSMEMVQKAVTAGFPLLAAISAPTSLAIELAEESGLTLAAFARGKGFTVYANPDGLAIT